MRIKLTDQIITETAAWTGLHAGQRPTWVQREYRQAYLRLIHLNAVTAGPMRPGYGGVARRAREEQAQIVMQLDQHPAIALLTDEEVDELRKEQ